MRIIEYNNFNEKEISALKELYYYLGEDFNYAKEDFEEGIYTFEEVDDRRVIWYIDHKHDAYVFINTSEIVNNG